MGFLIETARWKRCVPRRLPIYAHDSSVIACGFKQKSLTEDESSQVML
jgi:hypothetical protein